MAAGQSTARRSGSGGAGQSAASPGTVRAALWPERRYALREVKARLHQASFRDAVLVAYGGRRAISHLPEPRLLDAAHIIMDADEELGQPIVSNGLPLTKLHHAAFDAHLIGIDPDYRIHASDRLLQIHDGAFLELGLKGIVGQVIQLPRRLEDRPDRDRLALRFEQAATNDDASALACCGGDRRLVFTLERGVRDLKDIESTHRDVVDQMRQCATVPVVWTASGEE